MFLRTHPHRRHRNIGRRYNLIAAQQCDADRPADARRWSQAYFGLGDLALGAMAFGCLRRLPRVERMTRHAVHISL
jgi:hypothetical protein